MSCINVHNNFISTTISRLIIKLDDIKRSYICLNKSVTWIIWFSSYNLFNVFPWVSFSKDTFGGISQPNKYRKTTLLPKGIISCISQKIDLKKRIYIIIILSAADNFWEKNLKWHVWIILILLILYTSNVCDSNLLKVWTLWILLYVVEITQHVWKTMVWTTYQFHSTCLARMSLPFFRSKRPLCPHWRPNTQQIHFSWFCGIHFQKSN